MDQAMPKPLGFLLVGVGVLLAITNPGPTEFQEFAGKKLAEEAVAEFCKPGGLPMVVQLVVQNCPELIRAQQKPLGALASQFSKRINLGLFSFYSTEVAGAQLLPQLALPGYELKTIAVAGNFLVISASESNAP
ncbi:DUF4359 domain-containing protein [Synechococcus sp. UW140]|uniref:DUF4359 domain-containing protein n=1 Tax=Synechococcus sp. UW140 TaxID=368503 RepID=UPI0025F92503|nr:DUF4359 domain-containing protein [Synechococcus sp. UW140]